VLGLPTGTVTFLFTDIEGSTDLLERLGDRRYAGVLAEHHRLLRSIFTEGGGREISTHGDAFLVAFRRAGDALNTAVAAQRKIAAHDWPGGASLRVRMALHTGEPVTVAGDYVGLDMHRAARICAAGHGAQILLSLTTRILVEDRLPSGVSLRDLGLHRLRDLQQPERVFQVLHPDLPADFPPLRSFETQATNLPRQLTSFIGREREMAEVKRLLRTARLLTLTGTGGAGKTRLAIQVAGDVVGAYADGLWMVELGALSDPARVPQAVASALGVREVAGRPLLEALVDYLKGRRLLLVLDDCEHLVAACAHLTETLLRACPDLQILATSREVLNIAGEVTFPVPSLSVPDPQPVFSLEHLVLYEAVRLFVDRAMLAQPAFALTARNAPAVAQVVRRLDGIPLAIELAAARVKVLPVEQIAARLDDRFRLLAGGSRTTLPRHQTLRAAIDWSYELLPEKERAVLRRLSVFAGGWTLEAAEAVCAGDGVEASDVLPLLTQLVLKSLVLTEEQVGGVRYRLLETVRQYSRDRLMESGEAAGVRERHRDWYVVLAERAESELVGADQAAWFDRLETEHDNLRQALEWSLESHEAEAGLRLAGAAWRFWFVRGYLAEGRGWLEGLLRTGGEAPAAVRAKALKAAGNLAVFGQGDHASGRSLYEESLAIWRKLGHKQGVATLLSNLAALVSGQGDHAAARALYEESLAICRELKDQWGTASALNNLGFASYRQGDYVAARNSYQESLAIWRELKDKQSIARAVTNLGLVATREKQYEQSRALCDEGLVIRHELGDKQGIAESLEALAGLAAAQEQYERAARLFGAVEALREAIGALLPPADRPDYDRSVEATRAGLGEEGFASAWAEGRSIPLDGAIREARMDERPGRETREV